MVLFFLYVLCILQSKNDKTVFYLCFEKNGNENKEKETLNLLFLKFIYKFQH